MLKFLILDGGRSDSKFVLRNAHLLGADQIGVRASMSFDGRMLCCEKRAMGPVALCLQWRCGEVGEFSLQTCLLPEREEPYILSLELVRHRLMMILAKQEDWMMFDLPADHPSMRRATIARKLFVQALNAQDSPEEADRLACDALVAAVDASEELALAHAERLFGRRRQAGQFHRGVFGCGVSMENRSDKLRSTVQGNFDYLLLPVLWREIEPSEQQLNWSKVDGWAEWAYRNRMPLLAGPIVSFCPGCTPDWLALMAHDYETVRDVFYEHIERVVTRYRNVVTLWNVVSGVHTNAQLNLTLDQIMDLTRMTVMLVKKIQPNAKTLIEVTHPFGEYYATNSRSIPPFIYADMVLQAGIPIDAFGVKLVMGRAANGQYTRDLMQVSALLDRFGALSRPVHVTGVAVPSHATSRPTDPSGGMVTNGQHPGSPVTPPDDDCGYWRKPWSALVQTHWLEAFYSIALSKSFIDSVAWLDLADSPGNELPHCGLAGDDLKAKGAFHRLLAIRKNLHASTAAARNA